MKVLVTNVYSYKNKGDAAIVLALISEIQRVFPGAEICLQTTDVAHDQGKYGARVASSLMWTLFSSFSGEPLYKRIYGSITHILGLVLYLFFYSFLRIRLSWVLNRKLKEFVSEIDQADIVIACGGGYLCQTGTSFRSLLLLFGMCLSFLSGHYLGKPVYLYSQSVGPLKGWLGYRLVKFSLNRIQLLEVREDVSVRYVEQLGVRTPFIRTADPAFLLKGKNRPSPIKLQSAPLRVGITVRKWFSTEVQMANYLKIMARLVDFLAVEHKARVTCIPQVIASEFGDDDRIVAKRLRRLVQHKEAFTLINDDLHPLELIDLCGQMDIFIGTRMHSNIFALLNDVPVVAIMYEHKTQGIMDGLRVGDLTVNIEKLAFNELKQKVEFVIANRVDLQEVIKSHIEEQIRLSRSAMNIIEHDFYARRESNNWALNVGQFSVEDIQEETSYMSSRE